MTILEQLGLNNIIIVEQANDQLPATLQLKMRYTNHKADFDSYNIPDNKIEEMYWHGAAQYQTYNKAKEQVLLTLIRPLKDLVD